MILVPYTGGAATPSQVALAAEERGHGVVFVVHPDDAEAMAQTRLLEALGSLIVADTVEAVEAGLPAGRVAAVVVFAESVMPLAAEVAARLGLVGHDPSIVPRLVDKAVQRRRLNECGLVTVTSVAVTGATSADALRGRVPLPGVLKPTAGAGSRDTVFVDDLDHLMAELAVHAADAQFVVEARIPNGDHPLGSWLADCLSIESAVVAGGVTHIGISGRLPVVEPAREKALLFPIRVEEHLTSKLYSLAEQAISALGITTGLVHTEIKLSSWGPTIIEVNARLGGGLGTIMPIVGGVDPVGLALDIALEDQTLPTRLSEIPEPSAVGMHYYVQLPCEATQLVKAPDPRMIRRLPGVFGADRRAREGDSLSWRQGSAGRILDVWIKASSLAELESNVDAIEVVLAESTIWSSS